MSMSGKKQGPPNPASEFEAWVIQTVLVMKNDVSWVKRFMWVLAMIVGAALLGVHVY